MAEPTGADTTASLPPLDLSDLEWLIRFEHPEKVLHSIHLPGALDLDEHALAALFNAAPDTYRSIREAVQSHPAQSARVQLQDPAVRDRVCDLPFKEGERIVALGDSITDDYESWAEILGHLLVESGRHPNVSVENLGISGDTTASVLKRMMSVVEARPDWVVTLIGTNDATRLAVGTRKTLVSPEETARNLLTLRAALLDETHAQLVWITPPPVLERKIERHRLLAPHRLFWKNEDVGRVGDIVKTLPDVVVDLTPAFGRPPAPELLLEDGLHPSLAGQARICRQLVETLAKSDPTPRDDPVDGLS
jgi:lysophospholipase L1-like esterase